MELEEIKGIGEKTIEYLEKLNIYKIEDLVTYYPYRYNIIKVVPLNMIPDNGGTVEGIVESEPQVYYIRKNFNRMTLRVLCDNYLVNVTIFNRAFYKINLKLGRKIWLIGKYDHEKNVFTASDIRFNMPANGVIEPIYHLVNGVTSKNLTKVIGNALDRRIDLVDYIPTYLSKTYNLLSKIEAINIMHLPDTLSNLKKARLRVIYEEFFIFMFKMHYLKHKYDLNNGGLDREVKWELVEKFIKMLPFSLTEDQNKAVKDIYGDLVASKRMNRLILGDVGSGKTCVAEIGMYINYLAGYQSALMAPTEILARQHYDGMQKLFADAGIKIEILIGSMKKKEKEKIRQDLEEGKIDFLIGTHAILTDNVKFKNLGLVITDEQHRFGVNQRGNLQNKGIMCDVLYLSATPIPRTYALTLYGDMDTSIIKTKPQGRKEIITKVFKEKDLKQVLSKMLEEIKNGHQIYVVAPLIEDEEGKTNVNDVVKLKEHMDIAFNGKIRIEILHGKMKNQDKDKVMREFKNGEIKILISTTVIEVGVDVKNSTMMVIFNAERFGLATLHQLRGRVGRNDLQSYCYLISNMDVERLKVMEESDDGFYISQKDFELRGEGDLFGTKQSGDMVFKVGEIHRDYKILVQCQKDAKEFIKDNYDDKFVRYPQFNNIIKELEFID